MGFGNSSGSESLGIRTEGSPKERKEDTLPEDNEQESRIKQHLIEYISCPLFLVSLDSCILLKTGNRGRLRHNN